MKQPRPKIKEIPKDAKSEDYTYLPRERKFVAEYIRSGEPGPSYKAAGYTAKNDATAWACASKLLKKEKIKVLLSELNKQAAEIAIIDRAWVLLKLKSVAERCLQEEPVIREGVETGEFTFNAAGANKSLELLGIEVAAMFQKNVNLKGDLNQTIVFAGEEAIKD